MSTEGTVIELTPIRRAIASRMVKSKQEAPHFYVSTEILLDAALEHASLVSREVGERITVTSLLLRACAVALNEHPELNAIWTDEGLVRMTRINLGVAIARNDGLLAPALLDCQSLSVVELAARLRDLIDRTNRGKLRGSEMTSATFTLSNLGMFDVTAFAAIVTPPQVAILATGKSSVMPRYVGNRLVPKQVMTATLSADHRALDGVDVSRFLGTLKSQLEDPTAFSTDVSPVRSENYSENDSARKVGDIDEG